jgi:hypothetical protein
MYSVRCLFTDSFMRNTQYWSVGYFTTEEPAMQHDGTWVEIDALPSSVPFSDVESYVKGLNTPEEPAAEEEKAACPYFAVGRSVYVKLPGSTVASLVQGPCYSDEKAEELASWLNETPEVWLPAEEEEQAPEPAAEGEEPGSLQEQAQQAFGSCNWLNGLPVPSLFDLRAMGQEILTGQAIRFLSGFWYDGWSQTHQARVATGSKEQVWRLGANSGLWYS